MFPFHLFSLFGGGESGLLGSVLAGAAFLFSLWMAWDCWKRQGETYWIFLILATGGLFALIYFCTHYWRGTRVEYGLWRRLQARQHLHELERRAGQLGTAHAEEAVADALYDLRRFPEAEERYRAALAKDPALLEARVRLGYTLLELRRPEEAWPLLGKAYQEQPLHDNGTLVWRLARCQAQRGNLTDARNLYAFFLTKQSFSEARVEYAETLLRLGEKEAARTVLQELLREIEFSPRYTQRRERPWARAAKRLLRAE